MAMVDEVKRPVPIMLGIVAIVGWIYAFVLMGERTDLRTNLADQNQAVGTLEVLQREATALTSETNSLMAQRDEISAEITTQQSSMSNLESEVLRRKATSIKLRPSNRPLKIRSLRCVKRSQASKRRALKQKII